MPKPRPLGNKAKAQVEIAIGLNAEAAKLLREVPRMRDRHPDTADAYTRDALLYIVQAENVMHRLRAGDFED